MELAFSSGRFVSLKDELNYKEVIDDFKNAKMIRIITYNISRNQRVDSLLEKLQESPADTDIRLITNIPSRMEKYYNGTAGTNMRYSASRNIQIYLSKLDPENFSSNYKPFFNVNNHAKLIGTENIVYIGSANFSNESANNIESGILIEDTEFIRNLYSDFFDVVQDNSLSYYDEYFSAFRLFITSIYNKFKYHYRKIITDLYTDYERTNLVLADTIFMDINNLDDLYIDLEELESIYTKAEDTYDELSDSYNNELSKLLECFENIDITALKDSVSEGGALYELVSFDSNDVANQILQSEYSAVAYDENLNPYMEKSMDEAAEIYAMLHSNFNEESDCFLDGMDRILSSLEKAINFTKQHKASKINPDIDNT